MLVIRSFIAVLTLTILATLVIPGLVLAASTYYGIVKHVSADNIKVYNPKAHETLSFLIAPKFDKVFKDKKTVEMKTIKPGQYVGIIYDQKALGSRHADEIYILNNANEKIEQVKT